MAEADRIVVSYPADLSGWGRDQLDTRHFRAWLKRQYPTPEPGDIWQEFLDVGCCGDCMTATPPRLGEAGGAGLMLA